VFERFTERARDAVRQAQQEALALGHDYIGGEHLLLGLLTAERSGAARALGRLGVHADAVRAEVEQLVGRGESRRTSGQLPFTPQTKRVLEGALREALKLGHRAIGTEDMLLALSREREGAAAAILLGLDADPARIQEAVRAELPLTRPYTRFARQTFFGVHAATHWEYHVERRPAVQAPLLNERGQRGWELVAAVPGPEGVDLIFKRQQGAVSHTRSAAGE
jgi:hypothetical protein